MDVLLPNIEWRDADGMLYSLRPFEWRLHLAERYWPLLVKTGIYSDDAPKTLAGFLASMVGGMNLWFEGTKGEDHENVGFMYLTDFATNHKREFLTAAWHAVVWDGKAGPRRELARKFIKWTFETFRIHRLTTTIPLKFGGAIRNAKKIGFKEEGVLREARRFGGVWFNVLMLSILEQEARVWAEAEVPVRSQVALT